MDTVSIFGWIAADLCKVQRVVATRIASAGGAPSPTTPTLNFS